MATYYPAKLSPKLSAEEIKNGRDVGENMKVEKFYIFKENNQERDHYGEYKTYARMEGAEKGIVKLSNPQERSAYFERTMTMGQMTALDVNKAAEIVTISKKRLGHAPGASYCWAARGQS